MTTRHVVIILCLGIAAFCMQGCGSFEINASALSRITQNDPLDHVAYIGSDAQYHYFVQSRFPKGRPYRVRRDTLSLNNEFPLREGKPYVITKAMINRSIVNTKRSDDGQVR